MFCKFNVLKKFLTDNVSNLNLNSSLKTYLKISTKRKFKLKLSKKSYCLIFNIFSKEKIFYKIKKKFNFSKCLKYLL